MLTLRRKYRGFTLTEIILVITIIALVIGMAIPNYLRMRANASQSAAIKTLRTLGEAFEQFWLDQNHHRYPNNLSELDSVPAIQGAPAYAAENITSDSRAYGYYFSVVTPDTETYSIQATPINPQLSGREIYAITTSGEISSAILVCPSGNTADKFVEYAHWDAAPSITYSLPPGHPSTSEEIPPE